MKAKITFEDETGKKKIVFNISEEGNIMNIKAFALPPVEQKPVELMDLYEKLAGAFTNMITKK